jgi:hypothetical protein
LQEVRTVEGAALLVAADGNHSTKWLFEVNGYYKTKGTGDKEMKGSFCGCDIPVELWREASAPDSFQVTP